MTEIYISTDVETDGPIPFHFPAPAYEADLAAVAHG